MRVVTCASEEIETTDVVAELLASAAAQLDGELPKAGILFASSEYAHDELLKGLRSRWPDLALIGGTGDGQIGQDVGLLYDGVVLTLFAAEALEARVGFAHGLSEDMEAAVDTVMDVLQPGFDPRVAFTVFASTTDAAAVIERFHQRLPTTRCPLVGGLSGDHRDGGAMMEFAGDQVLRDGIAVLYLGGDIEVATGVGSGWVPVGPAYEISEADGHLLQRIGDKTATELYESYYGVVSAGHLGEFPLAISSEGPEGPWTLRAVMDTDLSSGTVRLAGSVEAGAWVRMTEVVQDGLLSGTMTSVRDALDRFDGEPQIGLLFSCAARKWVLGSGADREVDAVLAELKQEGVSFPVAGTYVYGEIAPAVRQGATQLHNETCVTVLLGASG